MPGTQLSTFLLLLLFAACAPDTAQAASASVQVSARILARTQVELLGARDLRISASDVERGYVDVPGNMVLHVRTNQPGPLVLGFESSPALVRGARIEGLDGVVELRHPTALLALPGGARSFQAPLKVRFLLRPDAEPGEYPWPLAVAAIH